MPNYFHKNLHTFLFPAGYNNPLYHPYHRPSPLKNLGCDAVVVDCKAIAR